MGTSPAERGQTGAQYNWKFKEHGICSGSHMLTPSMERRIDENGLCWACHKKLVKQAENTGGAGI
jgi:hypothetical protein